MARKLYSGLDATKIVRPNGTIGGSGVSGNMFVSTEGSIVHNDLPMPAGVSFSFEATIGPGSSGTAYAGLCSSNTTFSGKEVYVQGGNVLKAGTVVTPINMPTGVVVHFSYDAVTGDVTIRTSAQTVTVNVPELVGKPVYAFGTSQNAMGGLMFNFGATPYSLPVKDGYREGMFVSQDLDYSATVLSEQGNFESVFGNYFDTSTYLGNSGTAVGVFKPAAQVRVDVAETKFVYVHAHHGLQRSGGRGDGFGMKNHIGRNSKQIRMTPVVRFNQNAAMSTNGFEQNKQEQFKPREFWGDY